MFGGITKFTYVIIGYMEKCIRDFIYIIDPRFQCFVGLLFETRSWNAGLAGFAP